MDFVSEVISVKNVVVSKSFDDMLRDAEFPPVIKQIMTLARFSLRLHSCKNVKPVWCFSKLQSIRYPLLPCLD